MIPYAVVYCDNSSHISCTVLLILQVTHESNWKNHPNIANSDDNRGCDDDMVYTVSFENIGS